MQLQMNYALNLVYSVVDWFIPAWMKQDTDLAPRARMFVISHLFGPFLGHPITVSLFVMDPDPYPHVPVLGLSILAFWLFPIALRLTGQYHALALISVQNLAFATLWGCFFYGGVSSPFMPWLLMVPLLGFYYLGAALQFRVVVIGIVCSNLLGFYLAYEFNGGFPTHVPMADFVGVGMISIFCAAIYISLMAVYYANIVASESDMQREVHRHGVTLAELRSARDEAVHANNAKSEFLARMSHELRTPLNAVIGYSEMLLEDAELSGRGEEIADLEKINRAGMHLLALLTDVLDLSKIEAGKTELYAEQFELPGFIDDVAYTCRPVVAKNANQLIVRQGPGLGTVTCDMTKLRQAVINLLSNAGKFTSNGRITLETKLEDAENDQWFTISVTDTGIGIREDDLPRLFQNFSQADSSISHQFGGSGLGLALSRKLCRLMGGDITVESEFGKSASFTIRLPVVMRSVSAGIEGAEDGASVSDALDRPTVVVIDNDQASLDQIDEILTTAGYKAILTDDAEAGLHLARLVHPAAILLDVNDWGLLTALNTDEDLKTCPVLVQSNNEGLKNDFAQRAGAILRKPIDRDVLTRALTALCIMKELDPEPTDNATDAMPIAAVDAHQSHQQDVENA